MLIGHVEIDRDAVNTHRNSYLIDRITAVAVSRPFFAPGLLFGAGLGAAAIAFADLLYDHELRLLTVLSIVAVLTGFLVGRLSLLSRDLRGSELSDVIWGSYGHLNRVRRDIVDAVRNAHTVSDRRFLP